MIAPDKMNWVLRFILDSMGVDTAQPTVKALCSMMAKMQGLTSTLEASKMSRAQQQTVSAPQVAWNGSGNCLVYCCKYQNVDFISSLRVLFGSPILVSQIVLYWVALLPMLYSLISQSLMQVFKNTNDIITGQAPIAQIDLDGPKVSSAPSILRPHARILRTPSYS